MADDDDYLIVQEEPQERPLEAPSSPQPLGRFKKPRQIRLSTIKKVVFLCVAVVACYFSIYAVFYLTAPRINGCIYNDVSSFCGCSDMNNTVINGVYVCENSTSICGIAYTGSAFYFDRCVANLGGSA
jgi:hypothetical protein